MPRPVTVPAARTPSRPAPEAARVQALMRGQLRAALTATAALVLLLGSLPLVFALAPAVDRARIGGLGIAWVVLGLFAYPLLLLIARWYVSRVERNEAQGPQRSDGV